MTYACIVLYTPEIECYAAGQSHLDIWTQVTFYILATFVFCSLSYSIYKSLVGDKVKRGEDDDDAVRVDDSTPLLHEN